MRRLINLMFNSLECLRIFIENIARVWNPSSKGTDDFSENWHSVFGLFVPPISMFYNVIRKLEVDCAKGVLVLTCWRSVAFWSLISPNGKVIDNIVK